jgi:hypothetical protein
MELSEKISKLERELRAPLSRSLASDRNRRMDAMVSDLADEKSAEQLRIFKLVEAQFDEIEQQVKDEVAQKLERKKHEKVESMNPKLKAEEVLKKSAKLRSEEARKKKVTSYTKSAIPKLVSPRKPSQVASPRKPSKAVSFKEKTDRAKENSTSAFHVLQQKDVNAGLVPIAAPVIVDRSKRGVENQGLFRVTQPVHSRLSP